MNEMQLEQFSLFIISYAWDHFLAIELILDYIGI